MYVSSNLYKLSKINGIIEMNSAVILLGGFLIIAGLVVAFAWHWLPGTALISCGLGCFLLYATINIADWTQENIIEGKNKTDHEFIQGSYKSEDRSARNDS